MARIICLANSTRPGGRCIAGIDIDTGKWIRPVSRSINRAITWDMRNIEGEEPEILDVIEIPLENHGPDDGCQPENRLLKPGKWRKVGRKKPEELLKYREADSIILHSHTDCVLATFFENLPRMKWKSLQLVRNKSISFHLDYWGKWRAFFRDGKGRYIELAVKDPVFLNKLVSKENVSRDCIMTISLAGPWAPSITEPKRCYKLVAGVVEL